MINNEIPPKKCLECGKQLTTNQPEAKFCSIKCRTKFHNREYYKNTTKAKNIKIREESKEQSLDKLNITLKEFQDKYSNKTKIHQNDRDLAIEEWRILRLPFINEYIQNAIKTHSHSNPKHDLIKLSFRVDVYGCAQCVEGQSIEDIEKPNKNTKYVYIYRDNIKRTLTPEEARERFWKGSQRFAEKLLAKNKTKK